MNLGPLAFTIKVPEAGMFNVASEVVVLGTPSHDERRRPFLIGPSLADGSYCEGVLGSFSIRWPPSGKSVRCTFHPGVDYLSRYEFSEPVAKDDTATIEDQASSVIAVA